MKIITATSETKSWHIYDKRGWVSSHTADPGDQLRIWLESENQHPQLLAFSESEIRNNDRLKAFIEIRADYLTEFWRIHDKSGVVARFQTAPGDKLARLKFIANS